MSATVADPNVIVMAEAKPCEECGTLTDQLDVAFEAILCPPCNERLTAAWVFDTYTHCGKCEREFTLGFLHLGVQRGSRHWRFCIHCNFRGPTLVVPYNPPPDAPAPLPEPRRTAFGFIKGHQL